MSNWEKTMKEWDDSIPDGIKYLSAENRVLTRKARELESENANLTARIARLEGKIAELIEVGDKIRDVLEQEFDGYIDETIDWRGIVEEAHDVLEEEW